MFEPCQPVLINNLYGSLTIHTNDSWPCVEPRQWHFFCEYGCALLIRLVNITQLLSQTYLLKIYSIVNKQKLLLYDSANTTLVNNAIQVDVRDQNSDVLMELTSVKRKNMPPASFAIEYAFPAASHSRYGRQLLQENSSSSSPAFSANQPSFIALICVIGVLLVAIIVTITIFCYRHCAYRRNAKKQHNLRDKFRRVLTDQQSTDQTRLAASITPSSASSHSARSTQQLSSQHHLMHIQQQTSSLGLSTNTLPSILPSRRLQQSMMDAYLNDYRSFQPNTIDPKQLHSYLFIDLYSTSSETFPDAASRQYLNDNTTTSGYDTSTGGDDQHFQHPMRYRRRRGYYYQQRQRRRSSKSLKRSHGPRFLMRERSLPNNLPKLPQLRQDQHLFGVQNSHSSSTNSHINQDLISTNLSTTTDDYDDSHAYHVQHSRTMNTIEEEKPTVLPKPYTQQPYFFEMVSTSRGDDSDMPNYEDLRLPYKPPPVRGNGIAYVNDSIIV